MIFLTSNMIGSINDRVFFLTNGQVPLMGSNSMCHGNRVLMEMGEIAM